MLKTLFWQLERNITIPEKISVFRSPQAEAQYNAAYEAMLKQWPVSYEELFISTRFGNTHVIASGSKEASPLFLFQPTGAGAAQWFRNVEPFSQQYNTYAVDTIGEVNKSITTRRLMCRQDCVDWIADLFDGLGIKKADLVGNSYGGFFSLQYCPVPARTGQESRAD
jgi:pimeloyl-ACP methyl ester carboxylesterase